MDGAVLVRRRLDRLLGGKVIREGMGQAAGVGDKEALDNVITNALNIAALLIDVPAVRLIMPGGILRRESNSLSGHMAEAALANLQADRLYLGADGVDPELGVMTPHLAEAELNAKMIRISRQVVVVADSSKFMRRNISLIAKVEQLHLLITDRAAPEAAVEELRRRGVEVQLV